MSGYDSLELYRQWCEANHRPMPDAQWWAENWQHPFWASYQRQRIEHRDADQREIDRERMEGWTYQ